MSWVRELKVGQAKVYSLTDGLFRLDGGAMFGVVPKVLWETITPSDELNRIQLRANSLLIKLNGLNILVETGMDDKAGEKFEHMFHIERDETLFSGIKEVGLDIDEIDFVINSHLHFDHAGRNTSIDLKPTFNKARYIVQRQELSDALNPHERSRASYHENNFLPILEANVFDVIEGETEITAGLKVFPLPGHNLGQQGVLLESEGEGLVFCADLIPTFAHTPYPYIMGYDLYPMTTLEMRKRYLPEWFDRNYHIATPHDPNHPFGKLAADKKGFKLGP